jgi:hypothetical protein
MGTANNQAPPVTLVASATPSNLTLAQQHKPAETPPEPSAPVATMIKVEDTGNEHLGGLYRFRGTCLWPELLHPHSCGWHTHVPTAMGAAASAIDHLWKHIVRRPSVAEVELPKDFPVEDLIKANYLTP